MSKDMIKNKIKHADRRGRPSHLGKMKKRRLSQKCLSKEERNREDLNTKDQESVIRE